jgi:hypothetical protein
MRIANPSAFQELYDPMENMESDCLRNSTKYLPDRDVFCLTQERQPSSILVLVQLLAHQPFKIAEHR